MNDKLYDKVLTYDFESLFKKKGYAYFTNGQYNLNLIGVRSNNNNKVTNKYDDFLVVIYNTTKGPTRKVFPITTEPGATQVANPSNKKGVAILVPGQYRGVWKIDLHNGKYKALCQRNGAVKVYRDNNKDNVYDLNPKNIDKGWFGINIHRSSPYYPPTFVNGYSAGCQVLQRPSDFNTLMYLANCQIKAGKGDTFTYTLINEEDLV